MSTLTRNHAWSARAIFGFALFASAFVILAVFGTFGGAQPASAAAQYEYGNLVTICFHGKTLSASPATLDQLLARGATIGPCP